MLTQRVMLGRQIHKLYYGEDIVANELTSYSRDFFDYLPQFQRRFCSFIPIFDLNAFLSDFLVD